MDQSIEHYNVQDCLCFSDLGKLNDLWLKKWCRTIKEAEHMFGKHHKIDGVISATDKVKEYI